MGWRHEAQQENRRFFIIFIRIGKKNLNNLGFFIFLRQLWIESYIEIMDLFSCCNSSGMLGVQARSNNSTLLLLSKGEQARSNSFVVHGVHSSQSNLHQFP